MTPNSQNPRLTTEEFEVRIWGFVVGVVTLILCFIVIALLYSVIGYLSGCSSTNSLVLTTLALPQLHISPPSKTICPGEKITLLADGGINYSWQPGNNSTFLYSDTPFATSTYTLYGIGSNGCSSSTTATIFVDICEGLRTENQWTEFKVYPNPSNGLYNLHTNLTSPITLKLLDSRGQLLQILELQNGTSEIDLSNYDAGIYFLEAESSAPRKITKLVKIN